MSKIKKPRLGRGLSSLMAMPSVPVSIDANPDVEPVDKPLDQEADAVGGEKQVADAPGVTAEAGAPVDSEGPELAADEKVGGAEGLIWVKVDALRPNRFQPRRSFDEDALTQLAESIRREGVMQPVVVRANDRPDGEHELVAGERRWRAAQQAGLTHIPAVVRTLNEQQLAEWAVIENLQREDLNPIERAQAFRQLIDQFNLSQDDLAERVGIDRSTAANTLRLLSLSDEPRELVRLGKLSAGHGRALLGIGDAESQAALARRAVAGGWSVRMIEAAVKRAQTAATGNDEQAGGAGGKPRVSAHLADLEQQIAQHLQTKVRLKPGRRKGSGTLAIEFFDLDQFDALMERLGVKAE